MVNDLELTDGEVDEETGKTWKFVNESEGTYDQGSMTYQYVYQHIESGELWAFDHYCNSWADDYEVYEPYLVTPTVVTVTKYVRV